MDYTIRNGDCLEVLDEIDECSIDAIVTDPPYGLAFMGAEWDSFGKRGGTESISERKQKAKAYSDENKGSPRYANSHGGKVTSDEMQRFQEQMTPVFSKALRVAKPGAHLLCFGGTRTFHRMTCAIENAGWEIRDCIMWVYGSGFPKSMDVGKKLPDWQGWGTCLKPAWEPIIVARKPLEGTVANTVTKFGTGAINIDGCRIPVEPHDSSRDGEMTADARYADRGSTNFSASPGPRGGDERGRFPANLIHDGSDEVLACFPESKGQQAIVRGTEPSRTGDHGIYGHYGQRNLFIPREENDKSAARFFYCAKATKSDRGDGNDHPTVKPTELMRYLVRLVCRRGGVVLDPFMGSGSTGKACMLEGMRFYGIDLDPHYCEIAELRVSETSEDVKPQRLQMELF